MQNFAISILDRNLVLRFQPFKICPINLESSCITVNTQSVAHGNIALYKRRHV